MQDILQIKSLTDTNLKKKTKKTWNDDRNIKNKLANN